MPQNTLARMKKVRTTINQLTDKYMEKYEQGYKDNVRSPFRDYHRHNHFHFQVPAWLIIPIAIVEVVVGFYLVNKAW